MSKGGKIFEKTETNPPPPQPLVTGEYARTRVGNGERVQIMNSCFKFHSVEKDPIFVPPKLFPPKILFLM